MRKGIAKRGRHGQFPIPLLGTEHVKRRRGRGHRKGYGRKDRNAESLAKDLSHQVCDTQVTELYSGLYHQPEGLWDNEQSSYCAFSHPNCVFRTMSHWSKASSPLLPAGGTASWFSPSQTPGQEWLYLLIGPNVPKCWQLGLPENFKQLPPIPNVWCKTL